MTIRITLTEDELDALEKRVEVLRPIEFDLKTFSALRGIYGKILHIRIKRLETKIRLKK